MKNQPLVSILMNCYNGEEYLREAIESIYAQTYNNWEIIFVDNCSTDNSAEISKLYNDGRLKYYQTEKNIPLGAARNFGLKFVNGKYLAFLDTDDIWMFDKLEKQLKIINDEIAFIHSPVLQIDSNGNILRETKINKKKNFVTLLERYDINMHSTLINLKLVKFKFNESLSYCPDYELFMNIAADELQFCSLDVPLVKYRIHDKSLSSKTTDIQIKEILIVLNNIRDKYPVLNKKYHNSFSLAINKFKYLINTKTFLHEERYFDASKELFLLSIYDKKYLLLSLILAFPILNKIFYKGFIYKYV